MTLPEKAMSDDEFKYHVARGFTSPQKHIPAKYLYDEAGSELFNQITRDKDYYLTQAELDILQLYKNQIALMVGDAPFNMIDLGPGEGQKSELLIREFYEQGLRFSYIPIDISAQYLNTLIQKINLQFPNLESICLNSDYFKCLQWLRNHANQRNLVLFLGSSIGNFDPADTRRFLSALHNSLNKGDFLLLGFDICKDIQKIMMAFNDSDGITRAFNLNILKRLNRELEANFNVDCFEHYPTYNVHSRAMESYLVSLKEQTIRIEALHQSFTFHADEPIHVEYSYKYDMKTINDLAKSTGFKVIHHFLDPQQQFVDSLWEVG